MFPLRVRLLAMRRGELSAGIVPLKFKCLASGWKRYRRVKEITSIFPCSFVNHKFLWKKTQVEKNISEPSPFFRYIISTTYIYSKYIIFSTAIAIRQRCGKTCLVDYHKIIDSVMIILVIWSLIEYIVTFKYNKNFQ